MNPSDPSRLAAITAREQAATIGPWYVDHPRVVYRIRTTRGVFILEGNDYGVSREEDAEFIANAREDIPYLLAEVASLQVENTEQAALLEMVTKGRSPCGHWSAYAHTADGGKQIDCLQCEVARLQAERDEAETARDKARSTRDHWHAQLQIAEAARDEAQREKKAYARKIAIDCGADELEVDQAIEQS